MLIEPLPPVPKKILYLSLVAVVLTTMFERLAYYSNTGNFIMYVTIRPFLWSYTNATLVSLLLSSLSYFSALFFGLLSDVWVAKYYVVAYAMFVFSFVSILLPILYPYYGPNYILPSHLVCRDYWQTIPPFLYVFSNISTYICTLGNATDANPDRSLFIENCSIPLLIDNILMMASAGAIDATLLPFGTELVCSRFAFLIEICNFIQE